MPLSSSFNSLCLGLNSLLRRLTPKRLAMRFGGAVLMLILPCSSTTSAEAMIPRGFLKLTSPWFSAFGSSGASRGRLIVSGKLTAISSAVSKSFFAGPRDEKLDGELPPRAAAAPAAPPRTPEDCLRELPCAARPPAADRLPTMLVRRPARCNSRSSSSSSYSSSHSTADWVASSLATALLRKLSAAWRALMVPEKLWLARS